MDMDCFYAAVEMRDDPSLRGRPMAVGGRAHSRGVITTANYEARKFGVRSAMPSSQAARLCPDLVFVPPNFKKYREASGIIREIFLSYTPLVEPLSLDEAYLDVTKVDLFSGSATLLAQEIRKKIYEQTSLTASAGIAPNKFLAKVASDWKKPNGQFTISPKEVAEFVKPLKLSKIPGVGPKTFRKLELKGYKTCGDLQKLSQPELVRIFGKWGLRIFHLVRGEDDREVKVSRQRKSLSVENTFEQDLSKLEDFEREFKSVYAEFEKRWKSFESKNSNAKIKGFVVKLKFSDFQQITREKATAQLPSLDQSLKFGLSVFKSFSERPIRLLGFGVRVAHEEENHSRQLQFDL